MARDIDRAFVKKMKDQIRTLEFSSVIVQHNINAKWLIAYLAKAGIAFSVVNLGAGVKRVSVAENVCPNCGGKGMV